MRFIIVVIASMFLLESSVDAQWVSFTDETSSRLVLTPFTDDPNGNPMNDPEEKDIAIGDFDQDGDNDVIVVRKRPFSEAGAKQDILLMNVGGKLVDRTKNMAPGFLTTETDARDVLVADFTGDGWLDVVICNTFDEQPRFYRNLGKNSRTLRKVRHSATWLGFADETATRFPTIEVPGDVSVRQFCAVGAGDVNGDGALDLYFSNYDPVAPTKDVLFINNGTGTFTNETAARLGNLANVSFGTSAEIHDVDGDGDNDIVKTTTLYSAPPFDTGQYILYNDGSGNFSDFQQMDVDDPYMFTVGDLNGDGMLDLYVVEDSQDKVAINQGNDANGNVTFQVTALSSSPRTEGFGGNVKFRDIDNDGDLDVGVAPIDVDIQNCGDDDNNGFCILRNNGSGVLTDPYAASGDQNFNLSAHDFDFVDLNNDGKLDVILTLCTGWRILIQN